MLDPRLRFEVITDGVGQFLSLGQAGVAYDNGFAKVELGRTMEPDGVTREMTEEECLAIRDTADEYSANK